MSGLTFTRQYGSLSHLFFGAIGIYALSKAAKAFFEFDKKQAEMLRSPSMDGYVLRLPIIDRWMRMRDPHYDRDPRLRYEMPPMPFLDYYPKFAFEYSFPYAWADYEFYYNYGLPAQEWKRALERDGVNLLQHKRVYPRYLRLKRAVKRNLRQLLGIDAARERKRREEREMYENEQRRRHI